MYFIIYFLFLSMSESFQLALYNTYNQYLNAQEPTLFMTTQYAFFYTRENTLNMYVFLKNRSPYVSADVKIIQPSGNRTIYDQRTDTFEIWQTLRDASIQLNVVLSKASIHCATITILQGFRFYSNNYDYHLKTCLDKKHYCIVEVDLENYCEDTLVTIPPIPIKQKSKKKSATSGPRVIIWDRDGAYTVINSNETLTPTEIPDKITANYTDSINNQLSSYLNENLIYIVPSIILIILGLLLLMTYIYFKKCYHNFHPLETMELNTNSTTNQIVYAELEFKEKDKPASKDVSEASYPNEPPKQIKEPVYANEPPKQIKVEPVYANEPPRQVKDEPTYANEPPRLLVEHDNKSSHEVKEPKYANEVPKSTIEPANTCQLSKPIQMTNAVRPSSQILDPIYYANEIQRKKSANEPLRQMDEPKYANQVPKKAEDTENACRLPKQGEASTNITELTKQTEGLEITNLPPKTKEKPTYANELTSQVVKTYESPTPILPPRPIECITYTNQSSTHLDKAVKTSQPPKETEKLGCVNEKPSQIRESEYTNKSQRPKEDLTYKNQSRKSKNEPTKVTQPPKQVAELAYANQSSKHDEKALCANQLQRSKEELPDSNEASRKVKELAAVNQPPKDLEELAYANKPKRNTEPSYAEIIGEIRPFARSTSKYSPLQTLETTKNKKTKTKWRLIVKRKIMGDASGHDLKT